MTPSYLIQKHLSASATLQNWVPNRNRKRLGAAATSVPIFTYKGVQDMPSDAVLPFLKRESLERYGSYGVLYRLTVLGRRLQNYNHTVRWFGRFEQEVLVLFRLSLLKKRIRPMSDPSQDDWERLFREGRTLQRRGNHPNIIPLLASYTLALQTWIETEDMRTQRQSINQGDWDARTPPPISPSEVFHVTDFDDSETELTYGNAIPSSHLNSSYLIDDSSTNEPDCRLCPSC